MYTFPISINDLRNVHAWRYALVQRILSLPEILDDQNKFTTSFRFEIVTKAEECISLTFFSAMNVL